MQFKILKTGNVEKETISSVLRKLSESFLMKHRSTVTSTLP